MSFWTAGPDRARLCLSAIQLHRRAGRPGGTDGEPDPNSSFRVATGAAPVLLR